VPRGPPRGGGAREGTGRTDSRSLLTRARWLRATKLGDDAGLFLGGAALRLGDAPLTSLVNATSREQSGSREKVVEEALENGRDGGARRPPKPTVARVVGFSR